MALVNSSVFMYGGSCTQDSEPARGSPCEDVLWEFNVLSRQWTNLVVGTNDGAVEQYPGPRTGHAAAVWDNKMLLYGGSGGGNRADDGAASITDVLWVFDPLAYQGTASTNGWSKIALARSTIHEGIANASSRLLDVEGETIVCPSEGEQCPSTPLPGTCPVCENTPPCLLPRYGHAMTVVDDLVVIHGGRLKLSDFDLGLSTDETDDVPSEYRVRRRDGLRTRGTAA